MKNVKTQPSSKKLSRRKFIKIGSATLTVTLIAGGVSTLLDREKQKYGSIKASKEKPNKNPAFSLIRNKDGSALCLARTANGDILQHELNNTGAELYMACDGVRTRKQIIARAAKKLGKDPQKFAKARQFLAQLEEHGLIVTTDKVNVYFTKVVRYEKS